jgi:hypothetical protein
MCERPDYSSMLGFVAPAQRIDPHLRSVDTPPSPDLREVIEIVRDKRTEPISQGAPAVGNK